MFCSVSLADDVIGQTKTIDGKTRSGTIYGGQTNDGNTIKNNVIIKNGATSTGDVYGGYSNKNIVIIDSAKVKATI